MKEAAQVMLERDWTRREFKTRKTVGARCVACFMVFAETEPEAILAAKDTANEKIGRHRWRRHNFAWVADLHAEQLRWILGATGRSLNAPSPAP